MLKARLCDYMRINLAAVAIGWVLLQLLAVGYALVSSNARPEFQAAPSKSLLRFREPFRLTLVVFTSILRDKSAVQALLFLVRYYLIGELVSQPIEKSFPLLYLHRSQKHRGPASKTPLSQREECLDNPASALNYTNIRSNVEYHVFE